MDWENLGDNILEQYAEDIRRFFPDSDFQMGTPENGLYEEVMEKSEFCYDEYEDALIPFIHLYKTRGIEGASHSLSDGYNLLYYINKLSSCIANLLTFYCYHKCYFVADHRDEIKRHMLIVEQLVSGLQNECNSIDYSEYQKKNNKKAFKFDYIAERIKDIKFYSTEFIYGTHDLGEIIEPNNGMPPIRMDLPIPGNDIEVWALDCIEPQMKKAKKDRDRLMTLAGILLQQLLRVQHLFIEQMDGVEIIDTDNFFTPLFTNMSIAFEGSRTQKKARTQVVHKLNKAKGFGPLSQEIIERVWKEIDDSMQETRLGKLWDECGGDANEFSRNLFVNGCKEQELTEFLSAIYSKYYLEHPDELSKTKGIVIQKSETMISNPEVNDMIRAISKAANVNLTVNVAPNGDIVGTKQGENYGDNYSMLPESKVELPKKENNG